ncbi:MAG TPA: tetratricopeptide repeat protein [Planctomycetota bacterium]|nr:tetratricopeptide repeat protein [Planctomycetota bacterium]
MFATLPALLVVVAPLAQGAASRPAAWAEAEALERDGDLPAAARKVESLLAGRPDDVPLLVRAGLLRARSDAPDAAEAHLSRAVALAPKDVEAWLALGEARFRAQRQRASLEAFERALALGDADGRASNGIGSARYSLGEIDAAREAFARAAERNPRLVAPQHYLGRIALDAGRFGEAATRFRKCLELDPLDGDSHFRLGLALRGQGDADGAIEAFRAAIRVDPLQLGARQSLGQTLRAVGREEEGRAELEAHGKVVRGKQRLTLATESLKLHPSSGPNRVAVGEALLELGLPREALVHFREVLRSKKAPASAWLAAARAYAEIGDAAQRDEHARRALELAPYDPAIVAAARALLAGSPASRPGPGR